MPFQVSPGINVSEIDLTAVVPAVSTTVAGTAGHFRWGPVNKATLISSEDALVSQFNKPNADTATDFFTAANFLAYGNALYVDDINTSGTVSTENVALETSLNVYPNPAVNNFNVAFELTETADLNINLVNAIGQTLRTIKTGNFVAGEHILNVNTADLAAGTYFVTIRNGVGVTTKTITVQK